MTQAERSRMHIALLRVMGRMLLDIARAVTAAMVELREEEVDVVIEEDDDHGLMQTSKAFSRQFPAEPKAKSHPPQPLTENKAKKLRKASEPVSVQGLQDLLGSEQNRLGRSLMASLERMSTDDARRCAQNLMRRVLERYGAFDGNLEVLPADAQEILAGFVAFGADVDEGAVQVTGMDAFFVDHWWDLVVSQFPPPCGEGSSGACATMDSSVPGELDMDLTRAGTDGTVGETGAGPADAVVVPTGLSASTQLVPSRELSAQKVIDLNDTSGQEVAEVAEGEECADSSEAVPEGLLDRRQMLQVCEELKAASFRDWEDWEVQVEMGNVPRGPLELCVRGAVRHAHGGLGNVQSLLFHLQPNERVDLQVYGPRMRSLRSTSEQGVQTDPQ